MDYFVRDNTVGDGAVVDAGLPTDAAQKFIDITKRTQPNRIVDPFDLDIYPIARRNHIIDPVDMYDQENV